MGVLLIVISLITSFLGFLSFIAFTILKNYPAASLGFLAGCTDAIVVFLHILKYKRRLFNLYERTDLRKFARLGIIVASIGLLSLGYFTTIQILLKKPIMPVAQSEVIRIVWSIVVLRSGILMLYHCIKYQDSDRDDTRMLVNENESA